MTKKAIILAAGRGSRMREMTNDRPKGLVELASKPLVAWQIDALRSAGIDDIVIVTGYRGEQFAPYADRTIPNDDWANTNMVSSLICAAAEIDGPVIISYSDIVYAPSIVKKLMAAPGDTALAYDKDWLTQWNRRFEDPLSDAETFRISNDNILTEIGGKTNSLAEIEGQYMGLLRFSSQTIDAILSVTTEEERPKMDMTSLLMRLINAGHTIHGAAISGGWCEVDSTSDLRVAHEIVDEGQLTLEA
ncbi:NTP transferase domain-containing protein [Falsihalocynthiibacter sp. S25ZX9]|uniref:phosphocholine cytidylyltransferase family protein n=1 Tax=Falsihalocynthiibacter sp. S25ZX9 TaxID=3240870 RepID=UPI00350F961A